MDMLQYAVAVAFLLIALLAARLWWRRRSAPAAWLAWSFAALALAITAGQVPVPERLEGPVAWAARVTLVAFPYLLFRFVTAFQPASRRLRLAAGVLAATAIALTALVPTVPEDAAPPAWYAAYVAGVLFVWTALSSWAVWRLWHSGRRQPTVARRRMRILALAAAVLNAALVLAGVSSAAGGPEALTSAIQAAALLSAGLFYIGFAPPPVVRQMWRRADERELWDAEGELMAATTGREVVTSMLPHISRLLGGGSVLFLYTTGGESTYGEVPEELRVRLREGEPAARRAAMEDQVLSLQLRGGRLGVGVSVAMPLFGSDEIELLRRLGTLMDLAWTRSELYDLEQQARRHAESLADELESLVYGLSHDLRRPIVSVLGYADCLAEDYGAVLEGEGAHYLTRLRTNIEYMDDLVGDLLTLSRVGRVDEDPEPVDLAAVVGQTADELGREYPAATVEVGDLPVVHMDPARARQLFTNLVANALVHSGRPDVTVRIDAAGPPGCIAVTDDGRGIPDADREKVFALFARLEAGGAGHGTGIGLAMCRRIVESAGGSIWVADSDQGADIRVQLPLAAPGVAAEA